MQIIQAFDYLLKLTKSNKIKSFQIIMEDDTEIIVDVIFSKKIDKNKIKQIKTSTKVVKNIQKLDINPKEKSKILDFIEFNTLHDSHTKQNVEFDVENTSGKRMFFNLTKHAKEQFVKRFIIFANVYFENLNNQQQNEILTVLNAYNNIDTLETNKELDLMIVDYIKGSSTLNRNTLYRKKDIKHYEKRNNNNDHTIRVTNHPFLFIISTGILKTVELYSSSFKVDFINFNTTKDTFFNKHLSELKNKIN